MASTTHTTNALAGARGLARPGTGAHATLPAYAFAMAGASWQAVCIPSTDVITDHKPRRRRPEEVASQH